MPLDPTSLPETARHLIAARAYLAEHGWHQGNYNDGLGRVCLSEALRRTGARPAARVLLSESLGGVNVVIWNDAPGRTYEEVLAALDHAIALAVEEG